MLLFFFFLLQVIVAIPIPRFITRFHLAPAVTSTSTYITGTTTVWLPPIEIFISNGVTYTYTLTEGEWATTQIISTSTYVAPTTTDAGQSKATPTADQKVEDIPVPTSPKPAQVAAVPTQKPEAAQVQDAPSQGTGTTQGAETTEAPTTQVPDQASTQVPDQASTQVPDQASTTQVPEDAPEATTHAPENQAPQNNSPESTTQPQVPASETTSTQIHIENSAVSTDSPNTDTTDASTDTSSDSGSTHTSSPPASGFIAAPAAIVYSPYADDRSCKTYEAIQSDLQLIKSKGISKIRSYSTDCLSLTAVLPICKQLGITVNQGFWISAEGVNSIDSSVSDLIAWANTNGWDVFDFITIGNEAINSGFCSVSDLIAKISSVKSSLRSAGYGGHVTTAEPPATFIASPELCTASEIDFVAVQPHSYFNANLYASQAGEYAVEQRDEVAKVCSKSAYISETGYPHKGDTYGNNVPSEANQLAALESIMKYTGGDVTILTTYNDMWKDPGPHNIEQYFGMINLIQ